MKRLISGCLVLFISLFGASAHASLMARFELTCTNCATGGTFSRSWETPFDATTAPGYTESFPGAFFMISVPSLGGVFYAHSSTYPNGYNYNDNNVTYQAAMAGPSASLIFDGPTSAPVWKVGVYDDVVNYFVPGTEQGRARLSISAVPEPASLALVGLALAAVATSRRSSKREQA